MNLIPVEKLDSHTLWELVLTSIEDRMSQEVKDYLKEAVIEFHKRKVKLIPIMKVK